MYVPYSRVQSNTRKRSEGGETVPDQVSDSEIVIDPPGKSPFGNFTQKIYTVLDAMPEQQPIDSEATRPGSEVDEAIAQSGKRIEQSLDYVGRKVHDMIHVPPPEPTLSTEASRPGTEVDIPIARVGKHFEEYLYTATAGGKLQATKEPTKDLSKKTAEVVEGVKSKGSEMSNKTGQAVEDASKWTKDVKDSLSGAAHEYYKSQQEGQAAYQHEKEAKRTIGPEHEEHAKLAKDAREDQSAHISNAHQHLENLHPRQPGEPLTSHEHGSSANEGFFTRLGNWFTGKSD
jgi:uncharacterized protein YoxC